MAIDLHTHSSFSDGSDPPDELVAEAAAAGLTAIALTDHDTLAGIAPARLAAARRDVELIAGVEISCAWSPGAMHLVVLFLEPGPGPLQDRLAALLRIRDERNRMILDKLARQGIHLTGEELAAKAGHGSAGRPHVAALLVERGVVEDIPMAFDQLLARGRPAYVDRERLTPEEAIALARASGAVPILAHPHTLGLDGAELVAGQLERLGRAGLVGVECHYPAYPPEERAAWEALARDLGLIPSGGSDYHGTYKEGIRLGTGSGDLSVPDQLLEELRAARPVATERR